MCVWNTTTTTTATRKTTPDTPQPNVCVLGWGCTYTLNTRQTRLTGLHQASRLHSTALRWRETHATTRKTATATRETTEGTQGRTEGTEQKMGRGQEGRRVLGSDELSNFEVMLSQCLKSHFATTKGLRLAKFRVPYRLNISIVIRLSFCACLLSPPLFDLFCC